MARRCFERLDAEGIPARATVLRLLSDVDHVATQGAVWYVGGKVLYCTLFDHVGIRQEPNPAA